MRPARLGGLALAAACAAVQAQPVRYTIDPTHTFVSFEVLHGGLSTLRVRFDRKQGHVELDRAARSGRAELTIELGSVNSGVAAFDAALKGGGYFGVAEHPRAHFVADRFAFSGPRVSAAGGMLTLRGRSLPVEFKAVNFNCYTSPLFRREVCGGDFEAVIRRSAWGLGGQPGVAADEVRLLVQIEAIRQ